MTDERKPETPGLSKVSAKFVDEAEAAGAPPSSASVPDDPLIALGQQWQEAYDNWYEADLTGASDEEVKAQEKEKAALGKIAYEFEDQAAGIPAQSLDGVLVHLRMAGTHYHLMERDGARWDNTYAELTWQAWKGLERLAREGAAAIPGSVTEPEDAAVLLRQFWENVMVERGQLINRDDPKHPDVLEDRRLRDIQRNLEESIANTPTHTAAGVAVKLRQLQRDDEEFDGMGSWRPAAFRTALHALGRNTMPAIEDPVLALKREWEARYKALGEQRDPDDDSDEGLQPFYDRIHETEVKILRTQATTPAGIAIKLILWARLHCTADEVSGLSWTRKSIKGELFDLDRLPVLSALLDLERMTSATTVAGAPPAEDAALFDAIAEYDRLVAIERGLARRADVFREGTPEAKEAAGAREAAWDEVLNAWKKVQSIPATTQAGLFARVQVTDRFMSHLKEDDLYDEDWCIIKADVRRIAGEVAHAVSA